MTHHLCNVHQPSMGIFMSVALFLQGSNKQKVEKSHFHLWHQVSIGVNEQIRPGGKSSFDAEALAIKSHIHNRTAVSEQPSSRKQSQTNGHHVDIDERKRNWGRFDSSALHIQHALKQTEVQKKYSKPHAHAIESFLVSIKIFCLKQGQRI